MIDSHCHLTDRRLGEQLEGVLSRALADGVTQMITIGTDLDDASRAIALCAAHPRIRCAIGVHPNHAHEVDRSRLPLLRDLQKSAAVVALGEMGLDYFHEFADRTIQHEVFDFQLALAAELNRPVVIHSRLAIDDTLAHLRNFPEVPGVFHCFTGSSDEARRILAAGYHMGFTGPITYKKSDDLREIVRLVPPDRLLVETDAPYLCPEPVRKQKINEPAFVMHVARVVAQVKGWTLEQTDEFTTANVRRLFDW